MPPVLLGTSLMSPAFGRPECLQSIFGSFDFHAPPPTSGPSMLLRAVPSSQSPCGRAVIDFFHLREPDVCANRSRPPVENRIAVGSKASLPGRGLSAPINHPEISSSSRRVGIYCQIKGHARRVPALMHAPGEEREPRFGSFVFRSVVPSRAPSCARDIFAVSLRALPPFPLYIGSPAHSYLCLIFHRYLFFFFFFCLFVFRHYLRFGVIDVCRYVVYL